MRIRQRGSNGDYTYTKTIKTFVSDKKRIEQECKITKEEYLNLLMNADPTKKQIRKTRYCLVYENQYFEIDVYPFWNNQAIMEIELHAEDQEIKFPPEIKIIKEVTNDKEYKNYSLAKIK
jgi:CYTH domain-containing protein